MNRIDVEFGILAPLVRVSSHVELCIADTAMNASSHDLEHETRLEIISNDKSGISCSQVVVVCVW